MKYKKDIEVPPVVVAQEAVKDKLWFKIVVYGVVPLVGILLIVLLVWGRMTRCGKRPCRGDKKIAASQFRVTTTMDSSVVSSKSKKGLGNSSRKNFG